RRLRVHMWAMVAPLFERQQTFNAAVVDHVNRNVASHQETARAVQGILTALREELERLVDFESKLILYAQQITLYVDTQDRYVARLPSGLAPDIDGLSEELHKYRESMAAREQRYEARVADARTSLGVIQHAVQTLKREIESRTPAAPSAAAASVSDR